MSQIKVSVIIPVYNTQDYLRQCLDSVSMQTLDHFEAIIVNDCSTDGSADIIDEYVSANSTFSCVKHDTNKGLPVARNSGVSRAQGKYIIHLDSDDYWLDENLLFILFQTAETDDCDILRFNGLHHINGECYNPIFHLENIVNGTFEENPQFWYYRSVFLYFFRKSFLDEFKLTFIPDLNLGEDAIFLSSALPLARKISAIPDTLYAYRFDNQSLMRKSWSLANFIQEEKTAQIISKNIRHVHGAFIKYWSFRLSHYWSTKLVVRAFTELTHDERHKLIEFVSGSVAGMDPDELKRDPYWTQTGQKVIALLLKKDVPTLERYLSKVNVLSFHDPYFYVFRKIFYYGKTALKLILTKVYWTLIRLMQAFKDRIINRIGASKFLLKNKVFRNIEGRSDFNFELTKEKKPPGISVMLRVKNEEKRIVDCLKSIIELFEEIVVIDNGSTDATVALVEDIKQNHPLGKNIILHSYPFSIARCGAEHQATNENSLHSLAYYYNWCLSRCRYSNVCKWDADMILSSKMKKRTIFKRYLLRLIRAKRWYTGSLPVQTVYIDEVGNNYVSQNEINEEIRIFPNTPAVFFEKQDLWEALKMTFKMTNQPLEIDAVFEVKDVRQDEFSHWTSETFTGERKVREYRNFMYIKKKMHLTHSGNFTMDNTL